MPGYKRHIILISVFLCNAGITYCQNTWKVVSKDEMIKVFDQVNSFFTQNAYMLSVTHTSYQDYKTKVPVEKSVGYFKKDKNNYHSFLLGVHTIQNEKFKIVIDTASKALLVSHPDKNIASAYNSGEYKKALDICKDIKMLTVGNNSLYRFSFHENNAVSAYEITIAPEGMVKEISLYYNDEINIDAEDENSPKVKPRLNIMFSEYKKNPEFAPAEFNETIYIITKENKLFLSEKYKDFKLIDQRIPVK